MHLHSRKCMIDAKPNSRAHAPKTWAPFDNRQVFGRGIYHLLLVVQSIAEIVLGGLAPGIPAGHAGVAGAEQGVRVVAGKLDSSGVPQAAVLGCVVRAARVADLA